MSSFIPENIFKDHHGDIALSKSKPLRFGGQIPLFGKYPKGDGDMYQTIAKSHLKKGIAQMKEKVAMMEKLLEEKE